MKTVISSQRGAMFGLDARIALAIVAGTSVITGVSMMQSSVGARASALEQELANFSTIISNAQEAWGHSPLYFLGTAYKTPTTAVAVQAANVAYSFMDDSLLNPRPAKWVGPYFSKIKTRTISASHREAYSVEYDTLTLRFRRDNVGTSDASLLPNLCNAANYRNCYIWIGYNNVPQAISAHLDKTIDDEDNLSGKIRYDSSTAEGKLYYQGPRVLP